MCRLGGRGGRGREEGGGGPIGLVCRVIGGCMATSQCASSDHPAHLPTEDGTKKDIKPPIWVPEIS